MLYHQSKLGRKQLFLGISLGKSLGKAVSARASTGGILYTRVSQGGVCLLSISKGILEIRWQIWPQKTDGGRVEGFISGTVKLTSLNFVWQYFSSCYFEFLGTIWLFTIHKCLTLLMVINSEITTSWHSQWLILHISQLPNADNGLYSRYHN